MRSRAWSSAAACAVALLAVVALVSWRGPHVASAWSSALRVTAVVSLVALAAAVLVAAVVALGPRPPDRVRVAVPPDGPPTTAVVAHPGPRRWLLAAVAVAVLGTVPVLLVLVLSATSGPAVAAPASSATSAPGSVPSPVPPTTDPPGSPSAGPSPTSPSAAEQSPTAPSPTGPSPTEQSPTSPSAADPGTSTSAPAPPSSAPPASPPAPGAPPAPGPPAGAPPPAPPSPPTSAPPLTSAPPTACTALVVRGDTLWDLVRDRLPPGATPDRVAAATRAAYAANAAVIGPDPGLIRPGQVLDACG